MCLYPIYLGDRKDLKERDFTDWRVQAHFNASADALFVPCGHCTECLQQYSTVWAYRCALEASQYADNCFITLTYEKTDGNLYRRDIQLFLKRLRKAIAPQKVRYFYCGEYGSKGKRPHFHIILFNYCPTDLEKINNSSDLYRSKFVEDLWTNSSCWQGLNRKGGFISVGKDINVKSTKYCAKYLQKLNKVPKGLNPSFVGMSNRPGIAFGKINVKMLETDKIYIDGNYIKIPRYFLDKLKLSNSLAVGKIKEKRIENAKKFQDNVETIRKKRENEKSFIFLS